MAIPGNIPWRIRNQVRSRVTRLQYKLGLNTLEPGPARINANFRHPIDSANKTRLVVLYKSMFPATVDSEINEARRLLQHDFLFLGHTMHHDRQIAWARDPVSGRHWDGSFSADIDYRGPNRLGDIKLPWELNKHQYFFTLGKAAWLTDEPVFAQAIVEHIDHWISANPCHSGINWISALEAGSRVNAWILAFPFFRDFCARAFLDRLSRSLAQHLLFVEQNLSVSEFANTHLAGEAAILLVGSMFLDCRHSRRWAKIGLRHLNSQIHRQVREDGAHAEQSIAYHRFFLDHYFLSAAMLGANGRCFPAATVERMERMTQFLMDVTYPDGSVAKFGDGDDARGIWCHAGAPDDFRSLLALGAITFKRPDFKMVAREAAEEILWLHGENGVRAFAGLPSSPPNHTSISYDDCGYFVMRGGWDPSDAVLVFDCGPLGYGPAAHGHADALSFQLYANGFPFLIDPGTYSYNFNYQWRQLFRSTKAHSTVVVDLQDQAVARDRMSWTTRVNSRCRRWITTQWFDLVDGEHDGYHRLDDPVSHRRIVVWIKPDIWIVADRLSGRGPHQILLSLQVRPDCAVSTSSEGETVLESPTGERLRVLMIEAPGGSAASRRNGFTDETHAWFSPVYGEKLRTHSLQYACSVEDAGTIITCLTTSNDAVIDASSTPGGLSISLERNGCPRERLIYAFERHADFLAPGLRFDGDAIYQRGRTVEDLTLWASGFRKLVVDDILHMSSFSDITSISVHDSACDVVCQATQAMDPETRVDARLRVNIQRQQR